MKKSVLKIVALLMVAVVALTALASCGKKLSGEYYMGDKLTGNENGNSDLSQNGQRPSDQV